VFKFKEEITMTKVKITQDHDTCIGCGACVAICPDNWQMKDSKAVPKKTALSDAGCNQQAADSCPVNCIHVEVQK
jgi:ferredoxin